MRPVLNGSHSINATTINIKRLPASLKVLYVGDKFRINDVSTEYTVITSDVTSNASGEASIKIAATGIIAAYADLTPVQIPVPRPMTDNMRTAVSAETGTIIYFIKFDFDTIHRITDIVTHASGTKIKITAAAHGLENGDSITIDLPTLYAGTYTISEKDTNTFVVTRAFNADAATTGTFDVDSPIYITTAPTNISWNSITWTGIGGLLIFDAITETADLKGNNTNFKLSGVDPTILSLLLSKAYIGRDVIVWSGHVNSDGTILCDSSKDIIMINQMIGGFDIDHEVSDDNSETITITASFEDNSVASDQVIGIQTNPSSHQRFYPNDQFFAEIPKLMGKQIKFGDLDIGGGKGCFFWMALTLTLSSQVLKDNTLDTLRGYRDTRMEKSLGIKYKEVAPEIIKGITKYPCSPYVYYWIKDYTLQLSQLVKTGKYIEAEKLYNQNLKILEKFIG